MKKSVGTFLHKTFAKNLRVGDCFLPDTIERDWEGKGWIVKSHTLTERGDYSTFVESQGATWSERLKAEEIVWIREIIMTSENWIIYYAIACDEKNVNRMMEIFEIAGRYKALDEKIAFMSKNFDRNKSFLVQWLQYCEQTNKPLFISESQINSFRENLLINFSFTKENILKNRIFKDISLVFTPFSERIHVKLVVSINMESVTLYENTQYFFKENSLEAFVYVLDLMIRYLLGTLLKLTLSTYSSDWIYENV